MRPTSRRSFLRGAGAVGAALAGLRRAAASPRRARATRDLGPLVPDPAGVLDLPEGFTYTAFSRVGETMDDGLLVPGAHDGMAAFAGAEPGQVLLVRNHELTASGPGPFGDRNELLERVDPRAVYDIGHGRTPCRGGTTTLVFDTRGQKLVRHWLSLAGTLRNCAGGPTPWGSWITCEEAVDLPGELYERAHGYAFEVPAGAQGLVEPVPLEGMGRFNHEAAAVDPDSGAVYLTEDRGDGLLYRFLPDEPGELARGGRLQALAIHGASSVDTRNWSRFAHFPAGEAVEVDWIDLDGIDAPLDDLRLRGFVAGAARFARGEGLWTGTGELYFCCTSGGAEKAGQVWRYVPSKHEGDERERLRRATLELFLEPNDRALVDMCDNITVAPSGHLVLCEDGANGNNLMGVTPKGDVYPIAHNAKSGSEFAGATFSPDGSTLFVNAQGTGTTFAIVGPWPEADEKG